VTGEWRKLHNEELHDLYPSPSIIRIIKLKRIKWTGQVARIGEKINVYRLLMGNPEGKRPLERPRRKWVDNIKMDLGEIRWGGADWVGLVQERDRWRALVKSVINLQDP
jgi:predicted small integral membrane protein